MTQLSELSTLEAQLRMLGQKAFYQRRFITVSFEGKQMSWAPNTDNQENGLEGEPQESMHSKGFEYLFVA
ncbi:hypothetical protein, partial [Vibrio parahaemolyticus]